MSKKAIKKSEASASKKAKADRLLKTTRGKASNKGKR
jgi:hypothetical protein